MRDKMLREKVDRIESKLNQELYCINASAKRMKNAILYQRERIKDLEEKLEHIYIYLKLEIVQVPPHTVLKKRKSK